MTLALRLMKEMAGVLGDIVIIHRGKKAFIKRDRKKAKNPVSFSNY
jgi:hypothetical protein